MKVRDNLESKNLKKCTECNAEFVSGGPSQQYCSQLCYRIAVRKQMQQFNEQKSKEVNSA